MAKCAVWVPIIGSDRVLGAVQLENHEREYAYGESEVRLLQTVAASMGVALENARLFDETQRLLKETRAAQRRARDHQQRAGRRSPPSSTSRASTTRSATRSAKSSTTRISASAIYDPKTDLHPLSVHLREWQAHCHRLRSRSATGVQLACHPHARDGRGQREHGRSDGEVRSHLVPGTQMPRSAVFVPLVGGDQVRGVINLRI